MKTRRDVLAMLPAVAAAPASSLGAVNPAIEGIDRATSIRLWNGPAPGDLTPARQETVVDRSSGSAMPDRAVSGISQPRLLVFRARRPNGAALLVLPGGGYRRVVLDREGIETARWAQALGFTTFVLLYRLPAEGWLRPETVALSDAQRAMRLIRQRADYYGVNPDRVAVLGYSAGGHLCADLASRFAGSFYAPTDNADRLSARPFCTAQIYPVVSMDPAVAHAGSRERLLGASPFVAQQDALSPDMAAGTDGPPHFLVHAEDDRVVPVENTLRLRASLVRRGIPVETHLFANGGHGFGLGKGKCAAIRRWPDLWLSWVQSRGLVGECLLRHRQSWLDKWTAG